ncbi:PREDICTED: uncharacterized protein LOC109341601 [Lupinus angustifolius]|uniref:uncharacterized protein LOC109341601 n=1 Tax=Lupinus angustifolius TaxID=3871 RepID=UPI00092ECF4A|nr:PREDICTED: uncharacterized protein LOC109341601 [Lupinus angustifolius]
MVSSPMATAMNDPPVEASSPPLPSDSAAPIRVHSSFFSLQVPTAKLIEQNYLTWSQFMLAMLKSNRALRFVQSTEIPPRFVTSLERELGHVNPSFTAWEEQDQAVFSWILNSISETLHPRVVGCVYSWQLWNELLAFCNSHTKARSRQLRSQLRSLTQGSSNISDFFSKVKTLTDSLISIGNPISLEEHVDCILDGLNEDFHHVITSIESQVHHPSIHDLEQFLLTFESRMLKNKNKSVSDALSANVAAHSPPPQSPNSVTMPLPMPNMQSGGYSTPYKSSSRSFQTAYGGFFPNPHTGPTYGFPSMPPSHSHPSKHYTTPQQYHPHNYANHSSTPGNSSSTYHRNASHMHHEGSAFPAQYQGYAMNAHTGHDNSKASMWYPDSGATNHLTADPTMLHEPTENFGPDQIYMGNGTKASISCCGNTYFQSSNPLVFLSLQNLLLVPTITKNLMSVSQFAKDNCCYFEFHPNYCLVKSQDTDEVLLQGSLTSEGLYAFPSLIPKSAQTKFSAGPTSHNASALTSTTVNTKSSHFLLWHYRLGHAHKAIVKNAVQSDWGGEFRTFTKYLTSLGINHRVSCPHTHHQQGTVERKHRHIVETGLALLTHANLPLTFWEYAFTTAVYLINRLPTPSLKNTSPYFLLYNTKPDYTFLKVFGCACFPLLRPYNNHKLQLRSSQCTFLGYSSMHKGYKCLSKEGRLYISKDVVFNENIFPYASDSNIPNSSKKEFTESTTSITHEFIPRVTSPHVSPLSSTQDVSPSPVLSNSLHTHVPTYSTNTQIMSPFSQLSLPSQSLLESSSPESTDHTNTHNNTALVPTHHMVTRSKSGIDNP